MLQADARHTALRWTGWAREMLQDLWEAGTQGNTRDISSKASRGARGRGCQAFDDAVLLIRDKMKMEMRMRMKMKPQRLYCKRGCPRVRAHRDKGGEVK